MDNDRKEFRMDRFTSGPGELQATFANPLENELRDNTNKLQDITISNKEFKRLTERNLELRKQLGYDI